MIVASLYVVNPVFAGTDDATDAGSPFTPALGIGFRFASLGPKGEVVEVRDSSPHSDVALRRSLKLDRDASVGRRSQSGSIRWVHSLENSSPFRTRFKRLHIDFSTGPRVVINEVVTCAGATGMIVDLWYGTLSPCIRQREEMSRLNDVEHLGKFTEIPSGTEDDGHVHAQHTSKRDETRCYVT